MSVELRELRTAAELAALPELEVRVWGGEYEMVSVNVLVATISEGGVAIGAFDGGTLVGAVYGFATRTLRSNTRTTLPCCRAIAARASVRR